MSKVRKLDITELKTLSCPPAPVKELLTVTLLVLGYSEKQAANYKVCQRVLGDPGILQQMKNMDARSIPSVIVIKARTMLQEYPIDKVMKASFAAAGLYEWVAVMTA